MSDFSSFFASRKNPKFFNNSHMLFMHYYSFRGVRERKKQREKEKKTNKKIIFDIATRRND